MVSIVDELILGRQNKLSKKKRSHRPSPFTKKKWIETKRTQDRNRKSTTRRSAPPPVSKESEDESTESWRELNKETSDDDSQEYVDEESVDVVFDKTQYVHDELVDEGSDKDANSSSEGDVLFSLHVLSSYYF